MTRFLSYAVVGVLLLLIIGFFIRTSETAPNNAVVLVDDGTKVYYAPPCLSDKANLRITTIHEARQHH